MEVGDDQKDRGEGDDQEEEVLVGRRKVPYDDRPAEEVHVYPLDLEMDRMEEVLHRTLLDDHLRQNDAYHARKQESARK